jgi:hypothetical protein
MEYSIKNDDVDIEKNISAFTGNKIDSIIVNKEIVDGDLLVFYGDRKQDGILGFTLLAKGFNGKYRITSTQYDSYMHFNISTYTFKTSKSYYLAVGGRNYNSRIKKYNILNWDTKEVKINGNNIDGNNFLHLYPINNGYDFPKIEALDDKGDDITKEVIIQEYGNIPSSNAIGKSELFWLYVEIGIAILIGFFIAKYFWNKKSVKK